MEEDEWQTESWSISYEGKEMEGAGKEDGEGGGEEGEEEEKYVCG